MSMLDTVTCGLGGAIVILLYMASIVPQQAKLIFEELIPIDQPEAAKIADRGDPDEPLPIPRGILTLIFFPTGTSRFVVEDARRIVVRDCSTDVPVSGVIYSTSHTPDGLFKPASKNVQALSVSVWLEPNMPLPYCVRITPPEPNNGACQYSIIADGYATVAEPVDCNGPLDFKRDDNDPSVRTFEIRD